MPVSGLIRSGRIFGHIIPLFFSSRCRYPFWLEVAGYSAGKTAGSFFKWINSGKLVSSTSLVVVLVLTTSLYSLSLCRLRPIPWDAERSGRSAGEWEQSGRGSTTSSSSSTSTGQHRICQTFHVERKGRRFSRKYLQPIPYDFLSSKPFFAISFTVEMI